MDRTVQKILGCFPSGFTGMESHPEYSFLRKTDKAQERLFSRSHYRGSTIGLAGCGIWLFFLVILGMRAENRSGMWEF